MKNLYLILCMTLVGLTANAQNFFFEDFDGCDLPTGWTNTIVAGDTAWVFGDNAAGTPGGSVDGSCMAYIHDDDLGNGYPAVIADLESPEIDLSSLDTAQLLFDYVFEDAAPSFFAVAIWDGAVWDTVFTETTDPGCLGFFPDCAVRSAEINVTDYLHSTFKMKFIFDDGNGVWAWFIGIDNVAIYVPPTDDGQMVAMLNPVNGCGLSTTEPIGFTVYNNGQSTISSLDISYSVNGAPAVIENFGADILSAETDTFDLTSTVDLSVPGTYIIQAWIDVTNDPDAANDSIVTTIESIPVISSLPYLEDFELGAGGWVAGGNLSTWELGDPETAFIDTANSGVNAWVTNLIGNYNVNEMSYVESPCFDFSALTVDPVFRFAFMANSEVNWDGTRMEVSIDAGVTWAVLGNIGEGTNWYTNDGFFNANIPQGWNEPLGAANEYFIATHLLDGAAGSGSVKIRMFFHSDGSVNGFDGFA
ncbi:MAG: hypothetical protein ACI9EQ_001978, partial [Bacteroidia bacterium]